MRCDNQAMEITTSCVVALSWRLRDSLGELLDELPEAVEFLLGGDDLLPAIETALQGHTAGAELQLNLEPEDAFGDYDNQHVFLVPRSALPPEVEEGMLIEGSALPADSAPGLQAERLYTISTLYPEHVVLDGNHPLAGIALRLELRVQQVRPATEDELAQGSAGTGFFKL